MQPFLFYLMEKVFDASIYKLDKITKFCYIRMSAIARAIVFFWLIFRYGLRGALFDRISRWGISMEATL